MDPCSILRPHDAQYDVCLCTTYSQHLRFFELNSSGNLLVLMSLTRVSLPPTPNVQPRQAESGRKAEPVPLDNPALPSAGKDGDGNPSSPGEKGVGAAEDDSKGTGGGDGVRKSRSLKGAAPDEDNSSVASLLRARLGS